MALHPQLSFALGLPTGELHLSSPVWGGLSQGQPVDGTRLLQQNLRAGLQGFSIQTPHGRRGHRGRELTLKAGVVGSRDLHVLQLPDHRQRLGCSGREQVSNNPSTAVDDGQIELLKTKFKKIDKIVFCSSFFLTYFFCLNRYFFLN